MTHFREPPRALYAAAEQRLGFALSFPKRRRLGSISRRRCSTATASAPSHECPSPLVPSPGRAGCARWGPRWSHRGTGGCCGAGGGSGAGDPDKTQHRQTRVWGRFSKAGRCVSRSEGGALAASPPRSDQRGFWHLQIASFPGKLLLFHPPFLVGGHLPAEPQPRLLSPLLEIPLWRPRATAKLLLPLTEKTTRSLSDEYYFSFAVPGELAHPERAPVLEPRSARARWSCRANLQRRQPCAQPGVTASLGLRVSHSPLPGDAVIASEGFNCRPCLSSPSYGGKNRAKRCGLRAGAVPAGGWRGVGGGGGGGSVCDPARRRASGERDSL